MTRILLRAGKDPFAVSGPEDTLAANVLGSNSGNALFSCAAHRILSVPGAEIVVDGFATQRDGFTDADIARLNDEFDVVVLPMANAFRRGFKRNLDNLSRVVEGLRIPVVVLGVGAQLALDDDGSGARHEASAHVLRFVHAVLDRSASIGVRGEVTRRYLRRLGIHDEQIDVTGCPSLSISSGPPVVKKVPAIGPDNPITINLTAGIPELGRLVERHLDRYPRMDFLPQGNGTLGMMLWGDADPEGRFDPRLPHHVDHPMYKQGRMRFFIDPTRWIEHLSTRDFAFGTRIHGNVAALMAGTPAVALPWDSRTWELCDYHAIPHRRATPELMATVDAADLYEEADFTTFNAARAGRRADLVTFLEKNGLAATEGDDDADDYSTRLAAVPFAPAVLPVGIDSEAGRTELVRRLRWLRRSAASAEAMSDRLAGVERSRRDEAEATRTQAREVATLTTKLASVQRELATVHHELTTVQRERDRARRTLTGAAPSSVGEAASVGTRADRDPSASPRAAPRPRSGLIQARKTNTRPARTRRPGIPPSYVSRRGRRSR